MDTISQENIREYDISEIIGIAWNIFRTKYSTLFTIGFVVYLPSNIVVALMPEINIINLLGADYYTRLGFSASIICSMLLGFGGNIAIAVAVYQIVFNNDDSVKHVFSNLLSKIFKDWYINLLVIIIFFVSATLWLSSVFVNSIFFLLVSLPAIILLNYWVFGIYSFAIRDLNLYQSLKHSYYIVYGRWSRVFLYTVSLFLLSMVVVVIAAIPFSLLGGNVILEVTFNTLVSILSSFFVVAFTVFFVNFEDTYLKASVNEISNSR